MKRVDLITNVYCLVDDQLKAMAISDIEPHVGRKPCLSAAEVITIEIVGEYLGLAQDKAIWSLFSQCYRDLFPSIPSRTSFVRRATNLWAVKAALQKRFADLCDGFDDQLHIVDGFPIPICRFARVGRCRLFEGLATYGYCASQKEKFYGFKGHLLISSDGVICGLELASANIDERLLLPELTTGITGSVLGDKGYILNDDANRALQKRNVFVETPLRKNMEECRPPAYLNAMRRMRKKVETVISQLTERFRISEVWARDLWHLTSRIYRKTLSHTVMIMMQFVEGGSPLHLEDLDG